MLLYALLYLLGYEKMTIEEIKRFRQLGSLTPGHPEHGHTPGVETTTGPLGQGLANAVGMAIAERHLAALFGSDIVDHSTYVLASDGDLMEGISQEAIALAGHLKLKKLDRALRRQRHFDRRPDRRSPIPSIRSKRFEAAGWTATRIDGHDPAAIAAAIEAAKKSDRPSLIACRTTIGFGAPTKGGTEKSHGSPLGADEIAAARQKLGWTCAAFRNSGRDSRAMAQPQENAADRRGLPGKSALAALDAETARRIRAPHARRIAGKTRGGGARPSSKNSRKRRRKSPPAPLPNSRSKR